MTPPMLDLLIIIAALVIGFVLGALFTRERPMGLVGRIVIGIGLLIFGNLLYQRFHVGQQETCMITGEWIRFYDTPEMCSAEVIDRLTVDSDMNAGVLVPDPATEPVVLDDSAAANDGFYVGEPIA